ncbi:MAG: hypothetical protein F9K23_08630 [Bacteroidetes bacterium]|nr:MAG: hypothetical protein F9K23_08630 [Bacteroidota bacterium]
MNTIYDIHSNLGFIGFCIIKRDGTIAKSWLLLFETVGTEQFQLPGTHDTYNNQEDIDIIRDLMLKAIPTLRTNELIYYAISPSDKRLDI